MGKAGAVSTPSSTTSAPAADAGIPRPEYPRPSLVRADWLNLNGSWQFELDPGDSGWERGLADRDLGGTITVPFCVESTLSGIGDVDFHEAAWYRRVVEVPADWSGRRVLLHLQACDHDTTVWANGIEVARHRGGWTTFSADLGHVAGQAVTIVVRARDHKGMIKAGGKQSRLFANDACDYTRTTGIWQTVWLEPVADTYLGRPRVTPDVAGSAFDLVVPIVGQRAGTTLRAVLAEPGGAVVAEAAVRADLDLSARLRLAVPDPHLWSIADPFLYDLTYTLLAGEGTVLDEVSSYAGLRSVGIDGLAVTINGEPVFQRLVLDQGYYEDGILTAPSDEALVRDIELSMAAGFNGARLHQKVFEERFLYHADRLGYLVWGEFGDWGSNQGGPRGDNQQPTASYITQWLEAVERDYSHPAIVGWCPLNETWQALTDRITQLDDVTHGMFLATKALDPSRPVLDTSGYAHRVRATDVYDSHNYEQQPAEFAKAMAGLADDNPYSNTAPGDSVQSTPYVPGTPYFCSEFGGIWWNPDAVEGEDSWGYGERPKTLEEFTTRFEGLVAALLDDPKMFGYCYTQLTDVFQEQNGIFRFDRSEKFDLARVRAAQTARAAIET